MLQNAQDVILVGAGGSLGAIGRYLVSNALRSASTIPLGTLFVNILGSFLLGMLVTLFRAGVIETPWITLVGVGFLGSFTTMSTFAVETVSLSDDSFQLATINLFLMLVGVLGGSLLGRILAVVLLTKMEGF